jgi:S1-C subfamily serine protease
VRSGSPAANAGLKVGDRIFEVNRKRVARRAEWEAIVSGLSSGEKLLLRTGRGFFVVKTE